MMSADIPGFIINPIPKHPIRGMSWEMAAVMSLVGKHGNYTGTVDTVNINGRNVIITFGPILGLDVKDDLGSVVTSAELPFIQFIL